jgi:hypothetical protein
MRSTREYRKVYAVWAVVLTVFFAACATAGSGGAAPPDREPQYEGKGGTSTPKTAGDFLDRDQYRVSVYDETQTVPVQVLPPCAITLRDIFKD